MGHVDELKKVKVPRWAILLGRWRAWKRRRFARRQWRHITTVVAQASNVEGTLKSHAWYVLYERGDGKRTFTFNKGHRFGLLPRQTFVFNEHIQPWLDRKYNNSRIIDVAEQLSRSLN